MKNLKLNSVDYNSLRDQYKDLILNKDTYSMWNDWKFYILGLTITLSLYSIGVHMDILPYHL